MFISHAFNLRSPLAVLLLVLFVLTAGTLHADSAKQINTRVNATLHLFKSAVIGGQTFLNTAKGVLIIPESIKLDVRAGGRYGEGALRIDGLTRQFYSSVDVYLEFQPGALPKSIVLAFMSDKAMQSFRENKSWKVGENDSVTMIKWGKKQDITSVDIKDPIIGFVFDNKGLMYNLTLKGSKFTKISR